MTDLDLLGESEPYDSAVFYDCRASEVLSHETPWDSIAEFLDCFTSPGCDMIEIIRSNSPITVTAYNRARIQDSWIAFRVESLAHLLAEQFGEEFGNPNEDDQAMPADVMERFAKEIAPAVRSAVEKCDVWPCFVCGTRTYTFDDVVNMARREQPDWFVEENSQCPA